MTTLFLPPLSHEDEYDPPVPSRELHPACNGRPAPLPYRYQGLDTTIPADPVTQFKERPARKRGSPFIDPGGWDVCPPRKWR